MKREAGGGTQTGSSSLLRGQWELALRKEKPFWREEAKFAVG